MNDKISGLIYLMLLSVTGFLKSENVIDVIGIQWYYLSCVNLFFLGFTLLKRLLQNKKGNNISFSPSNVLIQAGRYGFVPESFEINFKVNSQKLDKGNVSRLKLRFSVLGLDKVYESKIRPWKDY